MKNFSLRLCLACAVLCCSVAPLVAQWHGYGTQASEACIALYGLPHIPELHTDMPLDCLIGYIAMDSLARTGRIAEVTAAPKNLLLPELRAVSRYVYAMTDYDPILLKRHFLSTMDSSYPNGSYQSYPANSYYSLMLEIYERREKFGHEYATLMIADYALHVRVIDARQGIDSTMFPPARSEQTNVACEVLEVFKGRHLPNNCALAPNNTSGQDKQESTLSTSSCLIYGHRAKPDRYTPKPGDEMILFLTLVLNKDNLFLVYPRYGLDATAGRYYIRDGRVEDPDNTWGLGTNPSFEDFRSNLLKKIDDIRSWTE